MERSCKGGSSQENDSANSAQYTRAARELSQGMFLNCHTDSKGPRERATSSIQTEVDFRSSAEKQRRFASFNLDQSTLDSTPRPGLHTTRNPSDNQPRHVGSDELTSLQMSSGKKISRPIVYFSHSSNRSVPIQPLFVLRILSTRSIY